MIQLRNIRKHYQMGDEGVTALSGVDLTIEDGEFVAIMGPSGSGKSTLMHILGLLDVPDEGSYLFENREVSGLKPNELALLRRNAIGFVFQQFNLLKRTSALQNVALPQLYSAPRIDWEKATQLLKDVGLGSRLGHRPNELSGGQQQRVAIARSLVNSPRLILADEPTGNLDSASEKEIMQILRELNARGITVILVTHEEEIARHARRVVRMRDGKIHSDERLAPLPSPRPLSASEAPYSNAKRSLGSKMAAHFHEGLKALTANKVRSGLSMLGILIGVAAVIAMLALGRGAQKAIETQLASLGTNLLVLRPGAYRVGGVLMDAGSVTRLKVEDAEAVQKEFAAVRRVAPLVNGRGQVTFGDKNWSTRITATTPEYAPMRAYTPTVGRFFDEEEDRKRMRVAVLGLTVVDELFGDKDPVGEVIKINKIGFQVIGVLPEKGNNGWQDQDDLIMIPLQTGMKRLLGKEFVEEIDIELNDPSAIEKTQDGIKELMVKRHRMPLSQVDSFQVRNLADIQSALSESSRTMSFLLASIAAISLLVGGIGIMNIMLVSVTERTREIGLRKAVGAESQDILFQFLVEAMVVSVCGGGLGVALGCAISLAMSSFAHWSTYIAFDSIFLAFFFSAGIGVLFGLWPARKASQLSPIEALRYE